MRTRSQARKEALIKEETIEIDTMVDQPPAVNIPKALKAFSEPKINDIQSSIVRPAIQANTFEIKPSTIQMVQNSVQFGGSPTEDPNTHIRDFIEICDTFKFNGVTDDAIRLRLFPISLRDKAKGWLHSLPAGSITTWEDLAQKFLTKFFPMAKTAAIRNAITQFSQLSGETLCEAWERYKEMLRKCPHHGMPDWMVINCFYNGLGPQSRPMLDAASGGALWAKSYDEAYELIEMMAANEYQNPTQRLHQGKAAGILDVDATTAIAAQLKALTMKVDSLANLGTQQPPSVCELCAGAHSSDQCAISSESAQFVSNFQRSQQPAPATYHPNNRNHPNFSWSNNQNYMPQQQQQFQQQGSRPFNPSGFQQQFAPRQQFHPPGFQQQNHGVAGQSSNERSELEELRLMVKSQSVSIKTLENQIGQITNALINRPQGTLPSDTEANPGKKEVKEQVQAVTLRSGKVTKDKESATERNKEESEQQVETTVLSSESGSGKTVVEADKKEINEEASKESTEKSSPKSDNGVKQVYPPPPFPKRLQKHKLDKQFAKFLEVFKKLQINIPFAEALEQMPSYAKFMKGILSRKLKLEELETVALTEECSAVLQQKLPPKLKDPGSFTIPCTIGQLSFDKCLCDLGASINLMPLSVFKKLGLPEPKPTNMSLQLADRSITYPRGIVEDVLVKVDKLIFPADFVILDFEEDKKIPIILGRPFLATGQTLIDVQKGELTMRVQDQSVTFKVFNAMKFPTDEEECFKVEPLEAVEKFEMEQKPRPCTLESVLTGDSDFEDEGVEELRHFQEHLKPSIEEAPIIELKLPPDLLSDVQFRRLSRRIDDMHDVHRCFAKDLTQALGSAFRAIGVEVDWPVFGDGMVYSPPDPPPEEGDPPDF
ncbi:uncharacterized protein LOC135148083 [Daucus carota subsp. sativus]|uniref:uncharacterized protein LOC135148083 n=1 Tax=Daucus carota subsp. sativus TaxID=79200 RepID=UPI003082FE33